MHRLRSATINILVLLASLTAAPACLSASEAAPEDIDTLQKEYEEAEANGEYARAVEIAEKMAETTWPQHLEVMYNIARAHCMAGNRSEAYQYLYWTVDSGFWDIMRMRKDEAFAGIRDEQLFKDLSRKAWSNGYLYMLERDEREEFQMKDEILEALGLEEGDRVADVGAGSGYFTVPVAKLVGESGRVLATDIRQEMLDYIERRLKIENLDNVELLKTLPEDPMLPEGEADLILMVDVYHYIMEGNERTSFGEKLLRGLAPGGRLVVIDYIPKPWEERPWGPPPQQHLPKETLSADLEKAGFRVAGEHDFLPEQYFVVYERK